MELNDVTIIIKTFNRPRKLDQCILSIRKYYPSIPIIVVDDGKLSLDNGKYIQSKYDEVTYISTYTAFDIGSSAGRNIALDLVQTKYFILLDDDMVFTDHTDLSKLKANMEKSPSIDMITIAIPGCHYEYTINITGNTLHYISKNKGIDEITQLPLYDIGLNCYIARTSSFSLKLNNGRLYDDRLKIGEHTAGFADHLNEIKIAYDGSISLINDNKNTTSQEDYKEYRGRATNYFSIWAEERGIKKYSINGKITDVKGAPSDKEKYLEMYPNFKARVFKVVQGHSVEYDVNYKLTSDHRYRPVSKLDTDTFLNNYELIKSAVQPSPVWIADGTLLGYYRDGSIIEHDTDTDVSMFQKDWNDKYFKVLSRLGFKIVYVFRDENDEITEITLHKDGIKTDIFLFETPEPYHVIHTAYKREPGKEGYHKIQFNYDLRLTTLTERYYRGHVVKTPLYISEYIMHQYGVQWYLRDTTWDWAMSPRHKKLTDIYVKQDPIKNAVEMLMKQDPKEPENVAFMIVGCIKYFKDLIEQEMRLKKLFPRCKVIPVVGIANRFELVNLDCNDHYEGLPEKVSKGMGYILDHYPDIKVIVKIDDDILFKPEDYERLLSEALTAPESGFYMGSHTGDTTGIKRVNSSRLSKCHNKDIIDHYCHQNKYVYGGCYMLSRDCAKLISENKDYRCILEDVTCGHVLKQHGIVPIIGLPEYQLLRN